MRLINTVNLSLSDFSGLKPPYAILSHTWGADDDEVTLLEMTVPFHAENTKAKLGFDKIKKFCAEVHGRFGMQWAWIDTCCIDKTSSAELSEAINSMFRWYQEAEFCVIFLADDPYPTETPVDSLYQGVFPHLKWFTRGWTLQELIAPKVVYFYNQHWELRGTKETLSGLINLITGIPPNVLNHRTGLDQIPISARMSWASRRQTKREEDIAYCLLGIFDINMPMLYGEGKKAFLRLQEEIIKQYADMSVFLWMDANADRDFSGLLAESPAQFKDVGGASEEINFQPGDYQITNRGVQFNTWVDTDMFGIRYISLSYRLLSPYPVAVALQKLSGDIHVRVSPDRLAPALSNGEAQARDKEVIIVAKTLTRLQSYAIHRNALQIVVEVLASDGTLPVINSEPFGCWNPQKALLYAGPSGVLLGCLEFYYEGFQKFAAVGYFIYDQWHCKMMNSAEWKAVQKNYENYAEFQAYFAPRLDEFSSSFLDVQIALTNLDRTTPSLDIWVTFNDGSNEVLSNRDHVSRAISDHASLTLSDRPTLEAPKSPEAICEDTELDDLPTVSNLRL